MPVTFTDALEGIITAKVQAAESRTRKRPEPRLCACGKTLGHGNKTGLCQQCAYRARADRSTRTPEQRERARIRALKYSYGLTLDDYRALLERQQHKCAICGIDLDDAEARTICVDHCHATGKVRGLLCVRCNTGIGYMKDDPARLRAAADYLERA